MKYLKLIFLMFLLTSCKTELKKEIFNSKVYIEILNFDTIKNNSNIKIKFVNNSDTNYCIYYDTISDKLILPEPYNFFYMKNNFMHIIDAKSLSPKYYFNSEMCDKIDKVRKHNLNINYKKSINNLIKLKARTSLIYTLNYNNEIYFSDFCFGNFEYNTENKYLIFCELNKEKNFLNKKMLDSIKDMGYKMYTKKIVSNKVPFKF